MLGSFASPWHLLQVVCLLLALLGERFGTWFELRLLFPLRQAAAFIGAGRRAEAASGWRGRRAARGWDLAGKTELK